MSRATVNGIDTYYELHGSGTPVLFIHGGYGGLTSSLVDPADGSRAQFLADHAQLIFYDRRSAFRSQYVTEPYTLADIADDAAALLDHLDVPEAIIVGSSAGGPVALQFALTWPKRVKALALPNTAPALMSLTPYADESRITDGVRKRVALVESQQNLVARLNDEGAVALAASRSSQLRDEEAARALPAAKGREDEAAAALAALTDDEVCIYSTGEIRNIEAYAEVDFTSRLGEIDKPTFIVHGNADERVPFEYGKDLEAGIAGAEFSEIDGAGHGITQNVEAQQQLAAWVDRVK
jgi:pimeloyl-ACP methyl ester carboxylesterase